MDRHTCWPAASAGSWLASPLGASGAVLIASKGTPALLCCLPGGRTPAWPLHRFLSIPCSVTSAVSSDPVGRVLHPTRPLGGQSQEWNPRPGPGPGPGPDLGVLLFPGNGFLCAAGFHILLPACMYTRELRDTLRNRIERCLIRKK